MDIEISILENGELIGKRTSGNWEIAEQNLESLKNWYHNEQNKAQMEDNSAESLEE